MYGLPTESIIENLGNEFFGTGKSFSFEILDISESKDIPRSYQNFPEDKVLSYDASVNVTTEKSKNRDVISVILFKEESGWKVIVFN